MTKLIFLNSPLQEVAMGEIQIATCLTSNTTKPIFLDSLLQGSCLCKYYFKTMGAVGALLRVQSLSNNVSLKFLKKFDQKLINIVTAQQQPQPK